MINKKQSESDIIKIPEKVTFYETPIATYWVDEYGIVCAIAKPIRRKIEHYEEVMALYAKLMKGGKKLCLLSETTNMPFRSEIREYVMAEMPKYIKANALVTNVVLERTVAETFMNLYSTPIEMNQFTNEVDAKAWLKQYL